MTDLSDAYTYALSKYSHVVQNKVMLATGALTDAMHGHILSQSDYQDALGAVADISQMALVLGEASRLDDLDGILNALLEMEKLSIGTHLAAFDEVMKAVAEADTSRRLFKSVQVFWSAIKSASPAIGRAAAEKSDERRIAVETGSRGLEMSFFEPGSVFSLLFTQAYADKFPRVSSMDDLLRVSSGMSSLLFFTAELFARSAGASWQIRPDERAPGHLTFLISHL